MTKQATHRVLYIPRQKRARIRWLRYLYLKEWGRREGLFYDIKSWKLTLSQDKAISGELRTLNHFLVFCYREEILFFRIKKKRRKLR